MRLDAWAGALRVTPMILDAARTIANMGKYPRLYDCYDATADAEDHQELVTPSVCPDSFRRARHDQDLVGSLTEAQWLRARRGGERRLGIRRHPSRETGALTGRSSGRT